MHVLMTTYAKFNILESVIKRLKKLNVNYTVYHDVDNSDTIYGINNRKIREYLQNNNINCKIRQNRVGKYNNIVLALKELFLNNDFVIVIDDDVLLTESYLNFCQFASEKYKNDDTVAGVCCSNLYNFYNSTKNYYISSHTHPNTGLGLWKNKFIKYYEKINLLKYVNLDLNSDIPKRIQENLQFFRDSKHLDINSDVIFSCVLEFLNFKMAVNCCNQIEHLDQIEMSRSKQEVGKYFAPIINDIPEEYFEITDIQKINEMDSIRKKASFLMNEEPRQF